MTTKQKINFDEINVNGILYVRKDGINIIENNILDGLKFSIIRTYSAGVFAGYPKNINEKTGTVIKAIRIYYWDGACSLSQLAVEGTKKPENCKFAIEVPEIYLSEIIEIIPCTKMSFESITGVKPWEI
ncbi:MAG: hypothetical protein EHM12_11205 [Dehalococcoidia bacterium]|nr:MAG: hypothetical protein EHM12_11205 [Dehalococcoidia bacterium]